MTSEQGLTPERWVRMQEIFHAALEQPAASRGDLVRRACAGDGDLRREVEALLRAHDDSGLVRTLLRHARSVELGGPPDVAGALTAALSDRYVIERPLGCGGMATVYLARDRKHDRPVALKVLRPELSSAIGARRFLQEIRVTANLQHPHILTLHDSGEAKGLLYYEMPYVAGGSLRPKLSSEGCLSLPDTVKILNGVAAALDYAHRKRVVHRDIKPENILLNDDQALVADFGIALVVETLDIGRLTETGLPIGTPNYMSPEQAGAWKDIDGRADIYSLACVVYECLTGDPPYIGPSPLSVVAQHLSGPVPSATQARPDIPPAVSEVIARALAKTPAERFATVADFMAALAQTAAGTTTAGQARATPVWAFPSSTMTPGTVSSHPTPTALDQEIHFCTTDDAVTIAYAVVGRGPPLLKAANWLSHLEFDWQSPLWRHWWGGLAKYNCLVRYDERGCGLSDWNARDMSLEAWVGDLEAVERAAGLERFALLGISQGGAIAISYAVRHPEKVTHLILHGAYSRGRLARSAPEQREQAELEIGLVKHGWGQQNPAFRQVFSTMFFPEASPEQLGWLNELQTRSASAENAARIMRGFQNIDVRDLARRVGAPTLVLHSNGDARVPFEEGRLLASLIPGSRFVPLASKNHIPLEHEPAWHQFLDAVWSFLGVGGR